MKTRSKKQLSMENKTLGLDKKRREKQEEESTKHEETVLMAQAIIRRYNFKRDSGAGFDSKGEQIFQLEEATKVFTPISERQLEIFSHTMFPFLPQRQLKEVIHQTRLEIATNFSIDMSDVAAVALADDADTYCFKRLTATKEQALAIDIKTMPGYQSILSRMNAPVSFIHFIGSLLDPKSTRTQYMHWFGSGGDGKSTVMAALENVLGHRSCIRAKASDIFSEHWGSQLIGARLLLLPDDNAQALFSTGAFKTLTGEDFITVNPKNQPHYKIRLTHKIIMLSNRHVQIEGDLADIRRLVPIVSAPDPEKDHTNKSWYEEVSTQGEKFILYCYAEYLRALARGERVDKGVEADAEAIDNAIAGRHEESFEIINQLFEVTNDHRDKLKTSVAHLVINKYLELQPRGMIQKFTPQRITAALAALGVEKKKSGVNYYIGLKVKDERPKHTTPTKPAAPGAKLFERG